MTRSIADLRLAARGLARAPLFSLIAVVSIALGVGTTTAVFTLLDQVALRPLPRVVRPEALVQISSRGAEAYGDTRGNGTEHSWPMFVDVRDRATGFESIFGRQWMTFHVGHQGETVRVEGEFVSGTYFPALGLTPAAGRLLTPADDRSPGGHPLVVLSHDFWQRQFQGRYEVVGQALTVNGRTLTVLGVAPRGFYGLELATPADLFVPLTMQPEVGLGWMGLDDRRVRWVQIYGRLATGQTVDSVGPPLQALYSALLAREAGDGAFAAANADQKRRLLEGRLEILPAAQGQAQLRDSLERPLRLLMAVAGGVLLIACANLANLLVVRGASRQRELALRVALGASRARLLVLLLSETALLAAAGSAVGVALASWGVSLLLAIFTTDLASPISASPDGRVLAFATAAAVATAMLAGVVPAWRATPLLPVRDLRAAGGGVQGDQSRLRTTLIVAQVALSFLLLAGAGLFVRTLDNLRQVSPGFTVDRVTSFQISPDARGYPPDRTFRLIDDLTSRLRGVPGVRAVGASAVGILQSGGWTMSFTVQGARPAAGEAPLSMINVVTPGFFTALQIPLRTGRTLNDDDRRRGAAGEGWPFRHAVVNETFARRYLSGRNPLGQRIGIGGDPGTATPIEIVGVIGDTKYAGLREAPAPQVLVAAFEDRAVGDATFYVRGDGPVEPLVAAIRREVRALDDGLAVFNVATLEERVLRSMRTERLLAALAATFAVLATLLAAIGLYGVMAYAVSRRTREIGLRIALGARATRVAGRIVREAGLIVAAGVALSTPLVWWLGGYVRSQLYGIEPADPWTLGLAAAGMMAVATLAAAIPARRAARIEPMRALRDE
jgi:predicted permease